MENLKSCPICSNNNLYPYLDTRDYFFSNENFKLVKCASCSIVITNPRPDDDKLASYYKSEEYISHSGTKKGLVNKIYHFVRNYTISKKFKLIKKYSEGKNIIDYGSATGLLLSYFNSKGYNTTGYEIDDEARTYSIKENKIEARHPDEIYNHNTASADAIMMWHVLEHISDPNVLLQTFHKILKDNGSLFIAVPNIDSFDANYYKEFWAALDVPRHLFHYNHKSIKTLLENNHFSLLKIKPMFFDSFYISIMSEKYKGNKLGFISGMFLGMISNIFALFGSKNYSSCLYIAKKT